MPHGHCYLWKPALVWLQSVSNGLIAAAYISISATLAYLVYRVRDIPFKVMYLAFGIFIISCGITHIFDVYVIWNPVYWLDGGVRALTAVASVGTAVALPPLVPKAIALARAARAAHVRGIELETVVKDLETMYQRARELEQLKSQFFANVSHELRTPLALILGPTEKLLAAASLSEEQKRDLDLVRRNARLLLHQVNDLLDASKLEAGGMTAEHAEVDLAGLVRVDVAHFDALAEERGIAYTVSCPPSLPAQIDPRKVQRVLLNLLSNAFKFTPAGGRIRVSLAGVGGRAVIEVADSGPGIRQEHREVVFERFRQLDGGSTRRFGGTGLGLAIVRDFVQLHGGTVSIGDAPEGGALFKIELPLTAPAGAQVRRASASTEPSTLAAALPEALAEPEPALATPGPESATVLIVEDNPGMRGFLAEALATRYRVITAADGREGLEKALALEPDLILSDMMMPGVSGDQLVRELRRHKGLDAIPVVLLTAKADDELRVRLLREGAQDYIMKPFVLEEVRARVGNLVKMKRARELLQRDLATQAHDVEALANEVTARKRELQLSLESMRVARELAEQASRFKSDLLGVLSHELRTPIASLQLQIHRLLRGQDELTERQRNIANRMLRTSERLAELIESLLQYARIEQGKLVVERRPVDVGKLLGQVVEDLTPHAEEKALTLALKMPAAPPVIQTDERLLHLVVVNLISNAVKFTETGGVEVSVSSEPEELRISVTDSGPGIPLEERSRIFEPFQQLEAVSAKHTPGVGLGLALVREMVRALDGRVVLRSEVGVGSTFIVVLPSNAEATGVTRES
ncbi:MAG TPA: ATP-binding protein [Myxococcaceae bacterium]|nr:ATP-binding protein [Myxococcaceae bacterium]